jgi:2'-5' RNA ligase
MPGVITLLEGESAARVEALWDAMAREFGVARGYPGAVPHFTYHLADAYDIPAAARGVTAVAAAWRGFEAQASGVGVFAGDSPVIFVPVIRSAALAALHAAVSDAMDAVGMANLPYYTQAAWLPHVTIAQGNVPADALGPLLAWLARTPIDWRIPVTNLAVADQTSHGAVVFERAALLP